MTRLIVVLFAMGLALAAVSASGGAEVFPVDHKEPITIRIVGGKDGRPLGRLHLVLISGYDRSDMREQLFREEVLTDAHGQARLSNQMANLPWLQVWVGKKSLCQDDAPRGSFSVALIRREGLSAPNSCGKATVEDEPGIFTVFVKGKGATAAPAVAHKPVPVAMVMAIQPAVSPAAGAAMPAAASAQCCCACTKKPRWRPACKKAKALAREVVQTFREESRP